MKNKLKVLAVNLVTTIRMAGIFALTPLYLTYGGVALGLANITCFLTDFIDGKMARKLNASTFFGSIYDGVSDKAFLAVNFAILCSITPAALIPLALELGILGAQYIKYKSNLNVQSSLIGKAKMWVAGLSMVLANFLIDVDKLQFLGTSIISKLSSASDASLVEKSMIPLVVAEVITLIGYIMDIIKKEDIKLDNIPEVLEVKDESVERTLDDIIKDKEKVLEQQEELYTLKEMLFDPEFYAKHKDDDGLKLLKQRTKRKK